jgi:hypothetical protein
MGIVMAHQESWWHFNNLTGSIDMLKIKKICLSSFMEWRSWWLTENLNDTSTISLGAALTCWRSEWSCYSNPGTKPKLEWDYDNNDQWQAVNLWSLMPKIINSSLPSIYWSKQPMKLFLLCHQQGCLDGPALPSLQTLPPLLHHQ